jgi:hypothetical protein
MLLFLRPALVLGALALAGLGAGAHAFSAAVDSRYDAGVARARAACEAYRGDGRHADAAICREDSFAVPPTRVYEDARAALASSRAAFARGDTIFGPAELARALDGADRLDRRGGLVQVMFAAEIVDEALDLLDAARVGPEARLAALAHVRLSSAEAPLEGERAHRLWLYTRFDVSAGPLDRAMVADAMNADDVELAEMNRALVAGDRARCDAAVALRRGPYRSGIDAVLCEKMGRVVATGKRLDRVVDAAVGRCTLRACGL